MDDFRKVISFDVIKKPKAMERMLIMITNWPQIPEYDKLYKVINKGENKGVISDQEFLVVYNLGVEILKLSKAGKMQNDTKISKYLFKEDNSMNYNHLLNFVKYAVEDIERTRLNNPNQKWELSINKILRRIEQEEGETKIVDSQVK